ncbi:SEFIR domain protein [Thiorhodococcus drewsii AZ1]|uniref:SEFIR domain protein n=1 Tax=Thiorhodococcus drewsii AZ1 TaxID=765913 RepID=G2E4N9_9GAMM|nr:tetratricopeptide repeat protein [Thiorhodococcus drewsii]EGV29515.1 SEFIR domain protein [Thiorhodococcus drewsii AZ1]
MSTGDTSSRPPRIFISYSHDSPEHAERVLQLALQLRRDGLDARLDRFETESPQGPSQGWPRWCAEQILAADFTLLVCTATYRQRFLGLETYGQGRGVKWEAKVIHNVLYYREVNTGFIPLILRPEDTDQIPETVRDASHYLIAGTVPADAGYLDLRERLAQGRSWPPLPLPEPSQAPPAVPWDATIPTGLVWASSEHITQALEQIQQAQTTHERRSRWRHWVLAMLILVVLGAVGGLGWQQWQTRHVLFDPVALKARMGAQIEETFQAKLARLKKTGARAPQIDGLYRWREEAEGQLDQAVAFVQRISETERQSLTAEAARVAQERGVEAALELLTQRLEEAGERHKARARELAEAALFKADLHETRLERTEARAAIEQAIALDHGWWEPHNRLGMLALDQADWKQAERSFQQARLLVTEKTDEATVINNLAQLLQATNRLGEAEPLMRRALSIDEASYGPEHPNVAIRLNNLAQLLKATNRLGDAEPLMRRALSIDEASYGPEHPKVAIRLNNLAQLLQDTNRLGEAEPLMRRVVGIFEVSYGPEHPNVATALNNLAQLLQATNRLGDAEPLMRRALSIDEASYGPEHPDVAVDLNNLAHLLQATNRLGEAEPLMRRHVVIFLIFTRQNGYAHPHLSAAFQNYRTLLKEMSLDETEAQQRIDSLGSEAGLDENQYRQLLQTL